MRVNPRDGRCRSCNGQLEIVDAVDDALTVRCESCGEIYDVETVIQRVIETNTCRNLDAPVEIWIDQDGFYSVLVH